MKSPSLRAAALALACAVAYFWAGALELRLGPELVTQPWRLWTAHLVHANATHFVLDVGAGVALLALGAGPSDRRRTETERGQGQRVAPTTLYPRELTARRRREAGRSRSRSNPGGYSDRLPGARARTFIWLAPAVAVGVAVTRPDLTTYVGLSGVLHGWFVLAVLEALPKGAARSGLVALVIGKALVEVAFGTTSMGGLDIGAVPVPEAHLIGALAALVSRLSFRLRYRTRIRNERRTAYPIPQGPSSSAGDSPPGRWTSRHGRRVRRARGRRRRDLPDQPGNQHAQHRAESHSGAAA